MNIVTLFTTLFFAACSSNLNNFEQAETSSAPADKATHITEEQFKTLVMDYQGNPQEWIFKGDIPAIVNFTADWCGPCRRMAPVLDELAKEYAGKIHIYKVNVDHNRNLSAFFGVRSIPTMLFARMEGLPALQPGAMGKEQLVNAIENFLLKKEQ